MEKGLLLTITKLTMKHFIYLSLFLLSTISFAQTDVAQIQETLLKYLNGSSYSEPEIIQEAFYESADLFLSKKDQEIWVLSPKEYATLFENRERGVFNGREGTILMIDVANNIALAKAEINIPSRNMVFIDIFLLKKLSGQWKIISKAATQMPN